MKRLVGKADAMMAMGFQLLLGAIPLAMMSLWTEDIPTLPQPAEFLIILAVLSVFGTSLPFWLWFAVLKEMDLNRANTFTFLVPLFGLLIGAILFKERLAWVQAGGVTLVLAGIVLVQRDARRTATF